METLKRAFEKSGINPRETYPPAIYDSLISEYEKLNERERLNVCVQIAMFNCSFSQAMEKKSCQCAIGKYYEDGSSWFECMEELVYAQDFFGNCTDCQRNSRGYYELSYLSFDARKLYNDLVENNDLGWWKFNGYTVYYWRS